MPQILSYNILFRYPLSFIVQLTMTNVIFECNLTHYFHRLAAGIITLEKDLEVKNNDSRN